MIDCAAFYSSLLENDVRFFAGVPDSLLKDICAYINDNCENHFITANEGAAIALASGFQLRSSQLPLVYMQNSGLGNAVNPLASLTHQKVYSIPMLLLIGWRGEPGVHDEPQHIKQGEITPDLLKMLDIPVLELTPDTENIPELVKRGADLARKANGPVALLARKGSFSAYEAKNNPVSSYGLKREQAIQKVAAAVDSLENAVLVSTTGMISRELYSYRNDLKLSGKDFYNVGSMGHASQIALGIATAEKERPVFCFDGDGAVLMHLGALTTIGQSGFKNFHHVVFDNEAHDSVGGQPTVSRRLDLSTIAKSCGYSKATRVESEMELDAFLASRRAFADGPTFLIVKVARGNRADLIRPSLSPGENKLIFQKDLRRD